MINDIIVILTQVSFYGSFRCMCRLKARRNDFSRSAWMSVRLPDRESKLLSVSGQSVAGLFADWARRTPDKPFLIWAPFEGEAQTLGYGEFWSLSGRVAAGLAARGAKPGDRIVIHM